MATRKVKHARMMERRAKWEEEYIQSGLSNLKAVQTQRVEQQKRKDEQTRKRKEATSKRLAKAHRAAKSAKPQAPENNPIRKKRYQEARGQNKEN